MQSAGSGHGSRWKCNESRWKSKEVDSGGARGSRLRSIYWKLVAVNGSQWKSMGYRYGSSRKLFDNYIGTSWKSMEANGSQWDVHKEARGSGLKSA